MKVVKITKQELFEMIQKEAVQIRKEINEEANPVTSVGDPTDVEMNQNDELGDSDKAVIYKDTKKTDEKKGTATNTGDVDMNANDSEEGSDKKAATAVEVKAGAETKGSGPTTGLKKANFDSKTENPSKEVSDPFKEKAEEKINSMDKENDEGTKTFVSAGAPKGGHTVTAGQHKAEVKEKAPEVKDTAPIATGIEIRESYKKSELLSFIKEEAAKIVKKETLSEELKNLNKELESL